MSLSAEDIANSELILPLIKQQASTLQQAYRASPRISSVFATQQRWLLAHAAMALYFRAQIAGEPGVTLARYLDFVAQHRIASRNTADAFIKEMLKYGNLAHVGDVRGKGRPMAVTQPPMEALWGWAAAHLLTLDRFDAGRRLERFVATDGAIARLEPGIAEGLLTSPAIRQPQNTFSLFTWLNNGGVIMDWLVAGLGPLSADGARYPTAVGSITEMAGWLKLSHTHLARKLREAEDMGSLGWTGRHGASAMWVSADFVREMVEAQAAKLAIIDAAFEAVFPG
jgi:hypothetical protein